MNQKLFLGLAAIVLLLDQATKYIVKSSMAIGQSIKLGIFDITYSTNTGVAFGLMKDSATLSVFLAFIVIGAIMYWYDEIDDKTAIPVALILGGTIGNLVDRVLHSRVIDFIDFRIWPIFNIADACLTIGVLLLVYREFTSSRKTRAS